MKALFIFLFLPFFFQTKAYSQTPFATDSLEVYRFHAYATGGIKGGINISSLSNFNRNESRLGMHGGVFGEYRVSPLVGFSTELLYAQQGTTHQNVEFGMNYLHLPVMLFLHDNNFTLQAGAYGAVLLKAKGIYGKITEDVTEHFKPTETGLCLGLSYNFFGNTIMGARYYWGAQNVNKSLTDSRLQLRNSTLQITGGYAF